MKISQFEAQIQFRNFYDEKKDEGKVMTIYDGEYSREAIDMSEFEAG